VFIENLKLRFCKKHCKENEKVSYILGENLAKQISDKGLASKNTQKTLKA
jgi:hypothetical protein